ncbi:hypothetical protein GMMP15_600009 [Candidatus Magnetomoraceae bacterium gMMP-15]
MLINILYDNNQYYFANEMKGIKIMNNIRSAANDFHIEKYFMNNTFSKKDEFKL